MNPEDVSISRISDAPLPAAALAPGEAGSVLAQRMPAVDLLRGTAVLMVLLFHSFFFSAPLFPWHNRLAGSLFLITASGWAGVNLFFVLSGFLITGNIVDSRDNPNFYARFYWRRALRILPVYFVTLVLLRLTGLITWPSLLVSALFLANMPGLFGKGILSFATLWSLGVEEQFYLFWPWIYRRLHDRGLWVFCLLLMLLCPLLRGLALAGVTHFGEVFSKTWNIADNLAIGALLALAARSTTWTLKMFRRCGMSLLLSGVTGISLILGSGQDLHGSVLGASIGFTCVECCAAGCLVLLLVYFRNRQLPGLFAPLVFFSEISYGLYLIHQIALDLYDRYCGDGFKANPRDLLLRFFIANGTAIVLATLSKRWFEDPVMRLRTRIPSAQ
jgi:peptidoglycan/LPS O-acetylase OafA/YrhL